MVNEFGRVCKRRDYQVNVGQCRVVRCTRYVNVGRMDVRINGIPLEAEDYFKDLGSQVVADGGCQQDMVHRMNEGYKALGALKSMLCNRGLIGNECEEVSIYELLIVPITLYGTEAWGMRSAEIMFLR